jgi:diguanylate cyclase (GGDEF)-like protein
MSTSTHHPKRQGLKLATSGLVLAVGITVLLDAIHFTEVTPREWIVLVAATAGLLGTVWGLLEVGGHLWHGRDPHFVLTPAVAVMILSCVLIRIAPESRMLVLGIWPVVLIFAAGYLGFRSAGLLSLLMTVGYLGAVWLARVPGARVEVELLVGGVFLATSLYSAVVLSRLRRQRNELAAARAELTRLALTDPLTGLANRRHFDGVLASELSRTARYEGATSLALVDLDHFKAFNDRHGHPAGDAALSEVAALLRERVRGHDTVARLGGEEFAVLMVGAGPEAAYRTAERIRASVNAREFGPSALRLSISIGVATAPEHGCTPAELVREADRALYRAKAAGRNTIVVAAGEATRAR